MSATAPVTARPENISLRHANYSPDWWTPLEWKDWVSATFGTADWFDPCPGDWKPEDGSGLESTWEDYCYVNHPGARNSTELWWRRYMEQRAHLPHFIWCCFNVEQLRHQLPSCLELPGWLVAPRERTAFVWGGLDIAEELRPDGTIKQSARHHGEPMKSPGNWAVWWTTVEPARPPVASIITRTGT